jgi:hypothetical protein
LPVRRWTSACRRFCLMESSGKWLDCRHASQHTKILSTASLLPPLLCSLRRTVDYACFFRHAHRGDFRSLLLPECVTDISYHQSPREYCDTISPEYRRTSDSFLRLMPQQSLRVYLVTIKMTLFQNPAQGYSDGKELFLARVHCLYTTSTVGDCPGRRGSDHLFAVLPGRLRSRSAYAISIER